MLRRIALAGSISALTMLAANAAPTGDRVDVAPGLALANGWCSKCHAVRATDKRSPNRAAPPFVEIATAPATSELALRAFLQSEHEQMPALRLTRGQIDQLVAYILSLRGGG
jgi:mono/diheme cytochrome c family protein